jgi:hypothetical protein
MLKEIKQVGKDLGINVIITTSKERIETQLNRIAREETLPVMLISWDIRVKASFNEFGMLGNPVTTPKILLLDKAITITKDQQELVADKVADLFILFINSLNSYMKENSNVFENPISDINYQYVPNYGAGRHSGVIGEFTLSLPKPSTLCPLPFAFNTENNINAQTHTGGNPDGSDSVNPNPNTGGSANQAPEIITQYVNFISWDDADYFYYIPSTNNPTSYSVVGSVPGLTYIESEHKFEGQVSGPERVESVTVTVSNEFGSDTKEIFFHIISGATKTLFAPDVLSAVVNNEENEFMLYWANRPFDGDVVAVEFFKNDVLLFSLPQIPGEGRAVARLIQNAGGTHDYKMRFINSISEISPFSETITVTVT